MRRKTFTVALVGTDGAGKTTISKQIVENASHPICYMYMGLSTLKSSPPAPTTYLIRKIKVHKIQKRMKKNIADMDEKEVAESYYREIKKPSFLRLAARNINYLIDVGYRLLFSFTYQLQGKTVLYDRHFLFNSAPDYDKNGKQKQHVLDAALYWIFKTLYPKPDLVIFLDAPIDILLSRKNEVSKDYLERRRNAIIAQGNITSNFKRVNAAQSLKQVEILVSQEIENLYRELDNQ